MHCFSSQYITRTRKHCTLWAFVNVNVCIANSTNISMCQKQELSVLCFTSTIPSFFQRYTLRSIKRKVLTVVIRTTVSLLRLHTSPPVWHSIANKTIPQYCHIQCHHIFLKWHLSPLTSFCSPKEKHSVLTQDCVRTVSLCTVAPFWLKA